MDDFLKNFNHWKQYAGSVEIPSAWLDDPMPSPETRWQRFWRWIQRKPRPTWTWRTRFNIMDEKKAQIYSILHESLWMSLTATNEEKELRE